MRNFYCLHNITGWFISLLVGFFMISSLQASAQIVMRDTTGVLNLFNEDNVAFYITKADLSFEEVKSQGFTMTPNLGDVLYEKGEYVWMRFVIHNKTSFYTQFFVASQAEYMDLYVEDGQEWEHFKNGLLRPYHQRDYKLLSSFIPFNIAVKDSAIVYVKSSGGKYRLSRKIINLLDEGVYY